MSCTTLNPLAVEGREASQVTEIMNSLVEPARTGDTAAADRLFAQARPYLLRVALVLGCDPDSAPDVVQETLLQGHARLQSYDRTRGSFKGWLAVILSRRVKNLRRDQARRFRFLERFSQVIRKEQAPPARVVEARLTLRRLMRRLTGRQRQVVALYHIGGLRADEVAACLGMTAAGVRSTARDARTRLNQMEVSP